MLSFRQPKICHTSSSNEEPLLLHCRSSGDTYSGQSSLANLAISEMSWVELTTDGTNESIIDEYKECFKVEMSALARSQRNEWREEPDIDFRRCGTCNIFMEFGYGRFNYFQRQMKVFDKKMIELLSSAFSMTYRLYLLHTSVRIEMDHHGVDGIED